MILSRGAASSDGKFRSNVIGNNKSKHHHTIQFNQFLIKRDYTAALTFLQFKKQNDSSSSINELIDLWIGYCSFHLGNYKKALDSYLQLFNNNQSNKSITLAFNIACCYFYLGMSDDCEKLVENHLAINDNDNGDDDDINESMYRLQMHLEYRHSKLNKTQTTESKEELRDSGSENFEKNLLNSKSIGDQLSVAALFYIRAQYKDAIDVYKKILLNKTEEYLALNVYLALCYYKLDYYDTSLEVIMTYLNKYPDSVVALNLKACNTFRLYNGQAAINEINELAEQIHIDETNQTVFGTELIRHNLVVFKQGKHALQVLPSLVDVIPEARLNLIIHYLRNDNINEAYELIKDLKPSVPHEYILMATVHSILGQQIKNVKHIKLAQEYFQTIGSSSSECDTIPGRQCMAATFFLYRQFEEVLVYLSSIKTFYSDDDTFNYNYAQAKAATGNWKEAEEAFLQITDETIKSDAVYITHLAKCYIYNKKSSDAWELYKKYDHQVNMTATLTASNSFNQMITFKLLQIIANDCYRIGDFWYSAKAFDILEHLEPNPEYWEGKRGAVVGIFQGIIADIYPRQMIFDIFDLFAKNKQIMPQAEQILRIVKKWAKDNDINV